MLLVLSIGTFAYNKYKENEMVAFAANNRYEVFSAENGGFAINACHKNPPSTMLVVIFKIPKGSNSSWFRSYVFTGNGNSADGDVNRLVRGNVWWDGVVNALEIDTKGTAGVGVGFDVASGTGQWTNKHNHLVYYRYENIPNCN